MTPEQEPHLDRICRRLDRRDIRAMVHLLDRACDVVSEKVVGDIEANRRGDESDQDVLSQMDVEGDEVSDGREWAAEIRSQMALLSEVRELFGEDFEGEKVDG